MQIAKFLKIILCLILFPLILVNPLNGQVCKTNNTSFLPGEELTFVISYNWLIVWTDIAEIKLKVEIAKYKSISAYHVLGYGKTYRSWDWFFKVRDFYEGYIDTISMKPLYFKRDIQEGNYKQFTTYDYDFIGNSVFSQNKVNDNPLQLDTVAVSDCTFDLISAVYYSRNLEPEHLKIGDTIRMTIILDQDLYNIYFVYSAIENLKIKHIGTIECNKFIISLVKGADFMEGSHMTLWTSNDKNNIPVYAESPIIIGSVKALLINIKGNRYPLKLLDK
jgi:hypothetical protein